MDIEKNHIPQKETKKISGKWIAVSIIFLTLILVMTNITSSRSLRSYLTSARISSWVILPTPVPTITPKLMKVMTFNIKGCRPTDAGYYEKMANRVVDELLTSVDSSGKRILDVAFAGFQEVDGFCGISEKERNKRTQNPTEDQYFITSLARYFVKDKDFFIYQRKIPSVQQGDFNSFEQMIISKYPMSIIDPLHSWPLTVKVVIPETARPLYVHVVHPRSNSNSCSSNTAYLDRVEAGSEGSNNIIMLGDFNARYYNGSACNATRVNQYYDFSRPIDPAHPSVRLDMIDYVMTHKESDWMIDSSIITRTFDVKLGDVERYWSDHNPVTAVLRYRGSMSIPSPSP